LEHFVPEEVTMDKDDVIDEIRGYYSILAQRGIDFDGHSPEELSERDTNYLIQHRNSLSRLARTPST
jgi:hypothetical protein